MSKFKVFWERIMSKFKVFLEKIGFSYGMRLAPFGWSYSGYSNSDEVLTNRDKANHTNINENSQDYETTEDKIDNIRVKREVNKITLTVVQVAWLCLMLLIVLVILFLCALSKL